MEHWLSRTELLIGKENLDKLTRSHVLVAGLGGVGGYAVEQLCRAGIGELTLIEGDIVSVTNRNRQLIALKSNEDQKKISLFAQRLYDINPDLRLHLISEFVSGDGFEPILSDHYNYVLDAIDTLSPKVSLLAAAVKHGHRVVSSMGSGGRLDPVKVEITDISESHHCHFAYIVRKYLHRQNIRTGIKVVFSPENVKKESVVETEGEQNKRSAVGTISYMPAVFGCYCASVVIQDLMSCNVENTNFSG
jgi:tRNA threonylcarbamoyladenosine dehydratase